MVVLSVKMEVFLSKGIFWFSVKGFPASILLDFFIIERKRSNCRGVLVVFVKGFSCILFSGVLSS